MDVDNLRSFWRFYRITSIYLCLVATGLLIIVLAQATGHLPEQVPSPTNTCTEGDAP